MGPVGASGSRQAGSGALAVDDAVQRMRFAAPCHPPAPLPACPAPAYHFRLLYKGVTMYPIMGALRHSYGGPWEVGGWRCKFCGRQALHTACMNC